MTILFESLNKNLFVFHAENVSQIVQKFCDFIDRSLLEPEDLENFIQFCYEKMPPSVFMEINIVLNKRAA